MDRTVTAGDLAARLADGPPIIIDGGTGTEIQRMGATMHKNVWSARCSLTDPDIVRTVHIAYLHAGAEIIIANTYSANYHVMATAGLADEFEPANRRAVELAREAVSAWRTQCGPVVGKPQTGHARGRAWIAGSMSTTTFTGGLDRSRIEESGAPGFGYEAQAEILAGAGVDFIMLEMMRDIVETRLCLNAALETGLPVWLGFSAERDPGGGLHFHGSAAPFEEGVARVLDAGPAPQALGVMHSEFELTPDALEALGRIWRGPVYAYPHHGVFEMPNWRFDDTLEPEEFAQAAAGWVRRGAMAVGGCCGIRPRHIAAMRAALDRSWPGG